MDDMNAFDRQLANVVLRRVGPSEPVDDVAIFTAITTTQSPKWRFQSMFNATKFVIAGVIVALFGGFLLSGVLTQPSDESVPAAEASASGENAEAVPPSVFALRVTGAREGQRNRARAGADPNTGLVTMTGMSFEAFDPVALKENQRPFAWELFSTLGPSTEDQPFGNVDPRALGSVTEVWAESGEMLSAENAYAIGIERRSTRVENDGGAWVGTATVPSFAFGIEVGAAFWELIGEGGYEGLTMFLWGEYRHYPDMLLGIIVPSDRVPDFPLPPPDTGAE